MVHRLSLAGLRQCNIAISVVHVQLFHKYFYLLLKFLPAARVVANSTRVFVFPVGLYEWKTTPNDNS